MDNNKFDNCKTVDGDNYSIHNRLEDHENATLKKNNEKKNRYIFTDISNSERKVSSTVANGIVNSVSSQMPTNQQEICPSVDMRCCISEENNDAACRDEIERERAKKSRRKNRKPRSIFTQYQLYLLTDEFIKNRYLGVFKREQLANKCNLTVDQVKIWFQNSRSKEKKVGKRLTENVYSKNLKNISAIGGITGNDFEGNVEWKYDLSALPDDNFNVGLPMPISGNPAFINPYVTVDDNASHVMMNQNQDNPNLFAMMGLSINNNVFENQQNTQSLENNILLNFSQTLTNNGVTQYQNSKNTGNMPISSTVNSEYLKEKNQEDSEIFKANGNSTYQNLIELDKIWKKSFNSNTFESNTGLKPFQENSCPPLFEIPTTSTAYSSTEGYKGKGGGLQQQQQQETTHHFVNSNEPRGNLVSFPTDNVTKCNLTETSNHPDIPFKREQGVFRDAFGGGSDYQSLLPSQGLYYNTQYTTPQLENVDISHESKQIDANRRKRRSNNNSQIFFQNQAYNSNNIVNHPTRSAVTENNMTIYNNNNKNEILDNNISNTFSTGGFPYTENACNQIFYPSEICKNTQMTVVNNNTVSVETSKSGQQIRHDWDSTNATSSVSQVTSVSAPVNGSFLPPNVSENLILTSTPNNHHSRSSGSQYNSVAVNNLTNSNSIETDESRKDMPGFAAFFNGKWNPNQSKNNVTDGEVKRFCENDYVVSNMPGRKNDDSHKIVNSVGYDNHYGVYKSEVKQSTNISMDLLPECYSQHYQNNTAPQSYPAKNIPLYNTGAFNQDVSLPTDFSSANFNQMSVEHLSQLYNNFVGSQSCYSKTSCGSLQSLHMNTNEQNRSAVNYNRSMNNANVPQLNYEMSNNKINYNF